MSRFNLLIILVILAMVLCGCNNSSTTESTPTPTTPLSPTPTATTVTPLSGPLPSIADVVEQVRPAVVYISVEYIVTSFFGYRSISTKTGSGAILSTDGYILTNNHVIEKAKNIEVVIPDDDNTYSAELVGADPLSDLAVIKIDCQNLPTAEFGDPSRLRVGDWVIALGNALGLEGGPSVTLGIVSNLERSFPQGEMGGSAAFYDVIQTDADINQGNSGGPLVDLEGKVVGINTFVISSSVETAGFAVSTNTVQRVYYDLIEHGRVIRPYLGVWLRTVTPALASELGLHKDRGVLVAYIAETGPASEADIEVNDVIVAFEDEQVDEAYEITELLWQHGTGNTVKLTLWRGNDKRDVLITLGNRPDDES